MKLGVDMKGSKAEACGTGEGGSSTRTEGTMKDNGGTTKWTGTANSSTREGN